MISAIIVDDEPKSGELTKLKLAKYCPDIEVIEVFSEPEKAILWLMSHTADVIFLDIEMPGISGLQIAKNLDNKTEIVFITAYQKYTIDAIRLTAFDYILKPIDIDELVNCMTRLAEKIALKKSENETPKLNTLYDKIALPTLEGVHFMKINDIIFVEAESNYSIFYFENNSKLMISKTLKQTEEALKNHSFFRAQKSYLINLNYISRYIKGEGGTIIMSNGREIELSRSQKKEFLELFNRI
jgi:two-component system LytT family response regulator